MRANSDPDRELDRAVRRMARELLGQTGAAVSTHPEVDELVSYQEGRLLGKAKAEQIRLHLMTCDECTKELEQLTRLDDPAEENPALRPSEQAADNAWMALRERLQSESDRDEEPPEVSVESRSELLVPGPVATRVHFSFRWVFAAVASVLVLSIAIFGLWKAGSPSSNGEAGPLIASRTPFLFDLVPDGERTRRAFGDQEISVPRASDLLIARLLLGDLTAHDAYRARIFGSDDRLVWEKSELVRQPSGPFVLLIPGETLPPGIYRLELSVAAEPVTSALAVYSFEIVTVAGSE